MFPIIGALFVAVAIYIFYIVFKKDKEGQEERLGQAGK